MRQIITQDQRLDYLVEAFKADSGEYRDLQTPSRPEEKRRILRSLMNIRMPMALPASVLEVQDAYLAERAREKGIVQLADIPVIRDGLSIWQGDITRLAVDAIVNAANAQMLGCFVPMHTCIDNCIHTFAGVQLRLKCAELMDAQGSPEPTGQAKITPAYNLPAKTVIHTVGTICDRGIVTPKNVRELESCYRTCMDLAAQNDLKSIAFCCISTGVFGFPQKRAAEVAVRTVQKCLDDGSPVEKVIFNVFKPEDEAYYLDLLKP